MKVTRPPGRDPALPAPSDRCIPRAPRQGSKRQDLTPSKAHPPKNARPRPQLPDAIFTAVPLTHTISIPFVSPSTS